MLGSACVEMTAVLEDLDSIRIDKSKGQLLFVSGGKRVSDFPDITPVLIMATDCVQSGISAGTMLDGLKFSARWERNGQSWRADVVSFPHREAPEPWPELGPGSAVNTNFVYVFSKGVPLTDKLVISVYSADGFTLAEFRSQLY
jgi:hypothetical protein